MARVEDRTVPADWNSQFFEGLKALQQGAQAYSQNLLLNKELELKEQMAKLEYDKKDKELGIDKIKALAYFGTSINPVAKPTYNVEAVNKEIGAPIYETIEPLSKEERKMQADVVTTNLKAEKEAALQAAREKGLSGRAALDYAKDIMKGKLEASKSYLTAEQLANASNAIEGIMQNADEILNPPESGKKEQPQPNTQKPVITNTGAITTPKAITEGQVVNIIGYNSYRTPSEKLRGHTPEAYLNILKQEIEKNPKDRKAILDEASNDLPELKNLFDKMR